MTTKEAKHHPLHEAIAGIVGSKYVADDNFALVPYSRDITAFSGSMPGIVVRPGSTEEVSDILKLANRTGYPVTLKGGGQSGGGITKGEPTRHIVLDMGRLDKVTVDVDNVKATCGGGIRPSMLDDALRPHGYYANTVIGPYYTASMAGVTSGIAGGGFSKDVATRGCNWTQILGLKVVLPTGDIITTGAGPDTNINRTEIEYREVSAPDLTGLFIGSGGALGIITEITLKIYPIPKFMKGVSYVVPTIEDVWNISLKLGREVPVPFSNIWMFAMDSFMVARMAGDLTGYAAMFFTVDSDTGEDFDMRFREIDKVCTEFGGVRGTPAMDYYAETGVTGTADFVHNACAMACPFMTWEVILPASKSLEYAKGLMQLGNNFPDNEKYHATPSLYVLPVSNVMLVGVTLHWDNTVPGADEHMQKLWKAGADYIQKYGATIVYCQGRNSNLMSEYWSNTFSKVLGGIKKTFDPNNILCPGLWNL